MGVDPAPSRPRPEPPSPTRPARAGVGASVLIAMLLSLPLAGDVQAAVHAHARDRARLAASPIQVLPTEIVRNLCVGIRYEAGPAPAPAIEAAPVARGVVEVSARPHRPPMIAALIDLPPPLRR